MKKIKKNEQVNKPWPPNMVLTVDHVDINSNGACYLYYLVKLWKAGQQKVVGKAVVNLSKDFRMLGFKGNFSLDLFADKMTRYEQDR